LKGHSCKELRIQKGKTAVAIVKINDGMGLTRTILAHIAEPTGFEAVGDERMGKLKDHL
jgi:hypothetical protein